MNEFKTLQKFMLEHFGNHGIGGTKNYEYGEILEVPNDKDMSAIFIVLPLWRGGNNFEVSHLRKGFR